MLSTFVVQNDCGLPLCLDKSAFVEVTLIFLVYRLSANIRHLVFFCDTVKKRIFFKMTRNHNLFLY